MIYIYKVEPTNGRNAICIFVFSDPIRGCLLHNSGEGGGGFAWREFFLPPPPSGYVCMAGGDVLSCTAVGGNINSIILEMAIVW